MRTNRLDLISIADIENVINSGADVRYSRTEIITLLEVLSCAYCQLSLFEHLIELKTNKFSLNFVQKLQDDNRVMIADGMVHMIS